MGPHVGPLNEVTWGRGRPRHSITTTAGRAATVDRCPAQRAAAPARLARAAMNESRMATPPMPPEEDVAGGDSFCEEASRGQDEVELRLLVCAARHVSAAGAPP